MQSTLSLQTAAPAAARPLAAAHKSARGSGAFRHASRPARRHSVLRAAAEETSVSSAPAAQPAAPAPAASSAPPGFVPVLRPEDLPKGTRKEVRADGKTVLMFWYRNQIYAIEARSPAEGAYSEGFIRAKFTQDFCIECPATGSLFSLKDGSIVSWYPNNAVLRMLTPASTCRNLEIYPVHLGQDVISVDVTGSTVGGGATTRGGSDTSLENNNVYGLEPKVYVEGSEAAPQQTEGGDFVANAATAVVGIMAVVGVIVAGGATAFYFFGP